MQELLKYLIQEITGSSDFEVSEEVSDNRITLTVKSDPSLTGLIIGKEGKTIKTLRKILSIRATNENTVVSITVI